MAKAGTGDALSASARYRHSRHSVATAGSLDGASRLDARPDQVKGPTDALGVAEGGHAEAPTLEGGVAWQG